ncbi:cytochrome P450 [Kitasatospora sp. NBC_01250]|uniref:cytochrome P450 n=1 Tax=Kitasatospora sp. NBC_01250 TaxID=2903571 RepID=UPI002E2FD4D6|nr:cytochrome P450 [Kitasatospora sp. NBC_01250]
MPTSTSLGPDSLLRRMFSPTGRTDPYPWYAQLRECAPVHRTATGTYVFSRYADAASIARDPAFAVKDAAWFDAHTPHWRSSAGMRLFGAAMLFCNGSDHLRVRKVMSAAFTPQRLHELEHLVRGITGQRLEALGRLAADGRCVDLHALLTLPLPLAVACTLTGVPAQDSGWVYELVQPLLALLDPYVDTRALERCDTAAAALRPYLSALLAERRRRPGDDLASQLARAQAAGRLTQDESEAALTLAMAAGFETTTVLLDHAISALMADPGQSAAVAEDPRAAAAAVEETLRHDPPVQLFTRIARRDTAVGDLPVKAGQEVLVLLAAAHRDPERFPEPDAFDLRRDTGQLLSFGGGAHYCLGAVLARMEARVILPALFRRFPGLRAAGPPQSNHRITMRGWTTLPVTLGP